MIGHITYLSETSMREKFGRRLQERERYGYDFATEFEVESYLKYHGNRFTTRFDANSFLYITKAIDYFDLSLGRTDLADAFAGVQAKLLVLSYSSDWLFPPEQSEELVRALLRNGIDASYVEIKSDYGHDAFLLEVERLGELTRDFLAKVERDALRPALPSEGPTASGEEEEQKVYPLQSWTNKARVALRLADGRRRETA
jgi:homoserine O-acetyltransferase